MNRFSYWKFTAVVAVLAMALVGFMRTSTATNQPLSTPSLAPGVDLSNEERALGRYFDDLVAHDEAEPPSEFSYVLLGQLENLPDVRELQVAPAELGRAASDAEILAALAVANAQDVLDALREVTATDAEFRTESRALLGGGK